MIRTIELNDGMQTETSPTPQGVGAVLTSEPRDIRANAPHSERLDPFDADMAKQFDTTAEGGLTTIDGEDFFQIANCHKMDEFFISLVGASDHWMFISSFGALTAGRRNANNALFPYLSDDKLSATRSSTGPVTIIRVAAADDQPFEVWEPFTADRQQPYAFRRNLYKTPLGHKLIFEEINKSLDLSFRYQWTFSGKFGFVRSCRLTNLGDSERSIELLDGLANVLPYGVTSEFILRYSNLGNAYKKNELLSQSGVGLYYLSSIPTDRAEPSEGLKATTVWQTGLKPTATLLSTDQVAGFRAGREVVTENDVRGHAGAYLVNHSLTLAANQSAAWKIIADVEQDHSDIVALDVWLNGSNESASAVGDDIAQNKHELTQIAASVDGLQCGANDRRSNRHLANTIFNVMRGGVPLQGYQVPTADFRQHITTFNHQAAVRNRELLESLPATISTIELNQRVASSEDADLIRLTREYMPLAFGRRHGDPTRPWNQFSIDLRTREGQTKLNYEGNWRDIFQNWEALALSFPEFLPAMICRFVNATTADGYNPYRITKNGFDWEVPEPNDPWANIGYWGDHQIIYLLRLMEWSDKFAPDRLPELLSQRQFVHADIPYRIKNFDAIRRNPRDTIDYDDGAAKRIQHRVESLGSDGKLLTNSAGEIHYVTLLEKVITLSLAKLANFIPDGGIWLNTQRPEWNDANNALVGNGVSLVTACYLHRWFQFLTGLVEKADKGTFAISSEVAVLLERMHSILVTNEGMLSRALSVQERSAIANALSQAGSDFREGLYERGPSGNVVQVPRRSCLRLFDVARRSLEATIRNNKRPDGLYHSYNLMSWSNDELHVDHLEEMLEGQVAVLSSGVLSIDETVSVLDALSRSKLYRPDQASYLLYPDRELPRFLDKNKLEDSVVESSELINALLEREDVSIVRRDVRGDVHFDGRFRNSADLEQALEMLPQELASLVKSEGELLVRHFDDIFRHRQFTGRSTTFFGYEGLGSIYWHMVSKLRLAVVEAYHDAISANASSDHIASLRQHHEAICYGIGAEKSPSQYGGFPTDPYSHTPEKAGVKQPGMTGQVKEDIIARLLELGIHIDNGCLQFRLELFDINELVATSQTLTTPDVTKELAECVIPENGFAFTLCQVPVVYSGGDANKVIVTKTDGDVVTFEGHAISEQLSRNIFSRTNVVKKLECVSTLLRARNAEGRHA